MEFHFLLPECGNNENNIGNYHPIELDNPEPVKHYLSCNHIDTSKIGKRQFTCEMQPVFDPRPLNTGLCLDKNNFREQLSPESTEDYLKNNVISCNPPICPGKMDAKRYFLNIDVESRLKNIDYYATHCKENVYKCDPNDNKCQMSCYRNVFNKDTNVPYPERGINKCIEKQEFPDISNDKSNPNIFIRPTQDTVYDLSDHEICTMKPERVWNNFTKRSMMDSKCSN